MNFLEERIVKDGVVKAGNVLKVDSFLNHQMDIALIEEIGREFKRRFGHKPVTKIITIEASGIGIAAFVAKRLSTLDSVISTATHFVLRRYKESDVMFLGENQDERGIM